MKSEHHKFLYWERRDEKKNDYFLWYKSIMALLLLSMFVYGWRDQRNNPKDVFGSHSYTDYVSNWNDMACSMWAVANAIAAWFPELPSGYFTGLSAFNAIAPTFSIGVAGAFWGLLPAERQSKDIVSLHQHGFLAVITVVDLLLVAAPWRVIYVGWCWLFATGYGLNTVIVYHLYGADRDLIYPFLNYAEKYWDGIKFDLMMTFAVQTTVFTFLYTLQWIKVYIHRRWSSKYRGHKLDGIHQFDYRDSLQKPMLSSQNDSVDFVGLNGERLNSNKSENVIDGFVSKTIIEFEEDNNYNYDNNSSPESHL